MKSQRFLSFLIHIVSSLQGLHGQIEFVICYGSPSRTISCARPNEVIDVHEARLAHAMDENHCTDPNVNILEVLFRIKTGYRILCPREIPFLQCHGQKTCRVDDGFFGDSVPCGVDTKDLNVLYVKYSCYQLHDSSTIQLSGLGEGDTQTTAETVDILSPYYPCNMPRQPSMICNLAPAHEVRQTIFYVTYKVVRFLPSQSTCSETINVNQHGTIDPLPLYAVCSSSSSHQEIRDQQNTITSAVPLKITYEGKGIDGGGMFWLQVSVSGRRGASNISVSCVSSLPPQQVDNRCGMPTSPVLTNENISENEDEESNDSLAIGISCAIGGIFVSALVFGIFYFCKVRKLKTIKQSSLPSESSTNQPTDQAVAIVPPQPYEEICEIGVENNSKYENMPRTYASMIPSSSTAQYQNTPDVINNAADGEDIKYEDVLAETKKSVKYENVHGDDVNSGGRYINVNQSKEKAYESLDENKREIEVEKPYTVIDLNTKRHSRE